MECSSLSLREACAHPDALFATPEHDLLRMVHREFTDDIDRLKRAYSIRDEPTKIPTGDSPSYILFESDYDEVNRTLVGFLSLRWIHLGQYERFVSSQPLEVRLTKESFKWIQNFYQEAITDSDALYALITSIIINDLGKNPQLALDYQDLTGIDISELNHDAILLKACQAKLIHTLERLPCQYRSDIIRGMELGATFNFGQMAQAENVPACLSGLYLMKERPHCFRMRFMEQILDIAGAAGHIDSSCARKLIQPIFDSYRNVYDACQTLLTESSDCRSAYDHILIRRAQVLREVGFRLLDVASPDDRALMRLLCMGNVVTLDKACLFQDTWDSIDKEKRTTLIHALNLDGQNSEPAVQPTYMPAFLCRIQHKRSLTCALDYLARVMTLSEPTEPSTLVIERSLLNIMKDYVEGGQFDKDPTLLESIDVPEGVVALSTEDSFGSE